jgi:branched-subunit amino acid transport protein AzlD
VSQGAALGVFLIVSLVIFAVADVLAWKQKGGETLSQWVVKTKKEKAWFRWLMLSVLLGTTGWLILHWELI